MSFSAPVLNAIDRLKNFYNSNAFNETTNAGGLANDGHQDNFPAALADLSDVADAVGTEAEAAVASVDAAAASAVIAGNHVTTAAGHAGASAASAGVAADQVILSNAAVGEAQDWATNPEDVEVKTGLFSALHWAAKAQILGAAEVAKALLWAEEDEDVEVSPGLFSARHWSAKAQAFAASVGFTLATVNVFTKAQRGAVVALADAASIAVDLSLANHFSVTLAGNRTLANPTNVVAGQSGVIEVTQDATGSRTLAFGANYVFAGGTAPELTTDANAVDVLAYQVLAADRVFVSAIADVKAA